MRNIFVDTEGRLRSSWAVLLFLLAMGLAQAAFSWAIAAAGLPVMPAGTTLSDPALVVLGCSRLAAAVLGTWVGCAAVRQPLRDAWLRDARAVRRLGAGMALGGLTISAAVLIPLLLGHESFTGPVAPAGSLLGAALVDALVLLPISASEEVGLRGFLLQQLGRAIGGLVRKVLDSASSKPPDSAGTALRFGNWAAVLLTGILFGVMHGSNPNVSGMAVVNIILVGVWFGALVLKTGSLWVAIGLHTGWNWFQGFFWGEPVSGVSPGTTLLQRGAHLGELWTGGEFGPEASAATSLVLAVLLVVTFLWRPNAAPEIRATTSG